MLFSHSPGHSERIPGKTRDKYHIQKWVLRLQQQDKIPSKRVITTNKFMINEYSTCAICNISADDVVAGILE